MSIETWIRIWRAGFCISIFGVIQFVVCCILAMNAYPGGSITESTSDGYSIDQNYLSDLGRNNSFNGKDNRQAALLFNGSLITLAVTIVPFFLFMPIHAPDRLVLLRIASIIGIISCCSLVIIALTPTDVAVVSHVYGLLIWILAILLTSSIHFAALFTSKEVNLLWSGFSLVLALLTLSYMGHGLEAASAVLRGDQIPPGAVIMQKVVVGSCLIWFFIFSLRTIFYRDLTRQAESIFRRDIVEKQALEYMQRIGQK